MTGVKMTQDCDSVIQNDACGACLEKEPEQMSRRAFLGSLFGVCSGAIVALIGMPMLRYILYPVQAATKASKWTEVGDASEFDKIDRPVTKTISLTQRDGW